MRLQPAKSIGLLPNCWYSIAFTPTDHYHMVSRGVPQHSFSSSVFLMYSLLPMVFRILAFCFLFRPRPGPNPPKPMILVQYVDYNLADICNKSGLQGISYTEGPLCPHCEECVLPLLWYGVKGRGENSYLVRHPKLSGRLRPEEAGRNQRNEDEPMIRCDKCLRDTNVYKLLKRKVCTSFFITTSHCCHKLFSLYSQSTDRINRCLI